MILRYLQFLFTLISILSVDSQAAESLTVPLKTPEGFTVPQPKAQLSFPRDHGSHPDFKIEWWYITGHLESKSARRFGYQATFFRVSFRPFTGQEPSSDFGSNQAFMSHFALTDVAEGKFYADEILARDSWDAYASSEALNVRIQQNTLRAVDIEHSAFALKGAIASEATLELTLTATRPVVRFGQDGTSRKGAHPTARSYYLSFVDLETEGMISIADESFSVTGLSWMDHEIASNQLDGNLAGWDWTAIQLDDGWRVKAYLLRSSDDSISPFSACIWISPTNDLYYQDPDAFTWSKPSTWESPQTGVAYPIAPTIQTKHPLTGESVLFKLKPNLENQELNFPNSSTQYWEGACRVMNEYNVPIGSAYLELVGYSGPVSGLR